MDIGTHVVAMFNVDAHLYTYKLNAFIICSLKMIFFFSSMIMSNQYLFVLLR